MCNSSLHIYVMYNGFKNLTYINKFKILLIEM